MASRFLLIEFDEEESATRLREQINAATLAGKKFRVVGLFAKPTNYCQCDPNRHVTGRGQTTTLKRGKRFGWWVCIECKRPSSTLSGLVNLLKPRDIINPTRWLAKVYPSYKTDVPFEHYIPTIGGTTISSTGVEYWNER